MAVQVLNRDKDVAHSLDFLQTLLADYHPRDFTVCLWNGHEWPAETTSSRFTLILNHPGALGRMFQNTQSDLSLGEAYIYQDFDIEGDIEAAFSVADYLMSRERDITTRLRLRWLLFRLPNKERTRHDEGVGTTLSGQAHSIERDRQAIAYHYDVSNDFYALWLDRHMVYSCAYFTRVDEALDTAQERKLDYLCRKLRLQPGERLLDIGCGWGGLLMHAVRHYGVEALGITLSRSQAEWATERIRQAGLSDRCRVEIRDYRQLDEPESFDKLVSVGMFEHVGEALLPRYFRRAWRLLRPGGTFLNHGIARHATVSQFTGPTFIQRYVFPDGELVPLNLTLRQAEESGFEIRDVESLREHYALTLRHWVRRLKAHHPKALQIVNHPTYRVWQLFMSGSAHSFAAGWLNLYQTLLVKPDQGDSGLPLTRADWYASEPT